MALVKCCQPDRDKTFAFFFFCDRPTHWLWILIEQRVTMKSYMKFTFFPNRILANYEYDSQPTITYKDSIKHGIYGNILFCAQTFLYYCFWSPVLKLKVAFLQDVFCKHFFHEVSRWKISFRLSIACTFLLIYFLFIEQNTLILSLRSEPRLCSIIFFCLTSFVSVLKFMT